MAKKETTQDYSNRAVFYTDGSAKPRNPGYTGWSVHGYVYSDKPTTKGAGHPKVAPTESGYVDKSTKPTPIDLVNYYDFMGWSGELSNNNAAEVYGCAAAIKYASTIPKLKEITIYSDSQYAVRGIKEWLPTWVANNWTKRDGSPTPDQEAWKELLSHITPLYDNKTKITVQWVKGHSDNFGNIQADQLASIAGTRSILDKKASTKELISEPTGYWKAETERHPMIGLNGMFFMTDADKNTKGEYYLCNQTKSHEFIGRNDVSSSYGYVILKEPDRLLEMVRARQLQQSREFATLVMARVDRVYDKAVCTALEKHGDIVFKRVSEQNHNMHFINEDAMVKPVKKDGGADKEMPITEELYPPLLALRCVEACSMLKGLTEQFIKADGAPELDQHEIFDITSQYFDQVADKHGEIKSSFKKTIHVSTQSMITRVTAFGREMDIQQVFTIHILNRNNLKRLEGTKVQIWLVVRKVSPNAVRYTTVIRSDDDWSAWGGLHSNLKVFPTPL